MTDPLDIRKKVLPVKERDRISFEEVSERFSVEKASVFRWSKPLEAQLTREKPATKIDPEAYQYERAQRLGVS
ncbi:MAG: hypothetical protein HC877_02605 [Thioploca sp.]|nr:hypothetical protein [Thioploca sp.]